MQPEHRADGLGQVGERRLHPLEGVPRRDLSLGRRPVGGAPRRPVEIGEVAALEAPAPRAVEGEIAHHPPRIGGLRDRRHRRRLGGEPQQHVLHHVLGERRAAQDRPGARKVAGAVALQPRERPRLRGSMLAHETIRR
ncbi:hypothetical protein GCM10007886_47900 [Methylobacterium gregans]|nr:hypothetical protein GCM10007886_47900 [Methylobacterium gregans]